MRFTLDASTRKTRRAATAPLRSSLLVWLAMMLPACSAGTDDQQAMPSEGGDGSGGAATGGILPGTGGSTAGSGGTASGGSATGGSATGGSATGGGSAAGGSSTGGVSTGGGATGGRSTGGSGTGGFGAGPFGMGGAQTGGAQTGGAPTGGVSTGGAEPGGAPTGGDNGGTPSPGVKFVGNITTGWNGALDTNGLTYSDYWDQVTPENAGKWGSVQGSPTSGFNWGTLDSIHDYTQRAGIVFKQHTFIWGAQQPEPQSSITETHVKTWMQEFCKRYPDTAVIDVVNEPPPHTNPGYANNIGGGTNGDWKWIANAFKWAREACPNAILILNDYNDIEWTNDNQHMIDIVKAIQAQDAPIDAIGCQAHDLDHSGVSSSNVKSMATKLHDQTGLPLYITEMDISTTDDAAQLRMYQDYMPFFLETEWIHGITIWGWIFGSTWSLAPDSGLVRNGSSRPAMTWLMEQLDRPSP